MKACSKEHHVAASAAPPGSTTAPTCPQHARQHVHGHAHRAQHAPALRAAKQERRVRHNDHASQACSAAAHASPAKHLAQHQPRGSGCQRRLYESYGHRVRQWQREDGHVVRGHGQGAEHAPQQQPLEVAALAVQWVDALQATCARLGGGCSWWPAHSTGMAAIGAVEMAATVCTAHLCCLPSVPRDSCSAGRSTRCCRAGLQLQCRAQALRLHGLQRAVLRQHAA